LHVCGDFSCIDLAERLCSLSGKTFEKREYQRLTSLTLDEAGLGESGYSSLEPGDCVVAFSKRELYGIKQEIENSTGAATNHCSAALCMSADVAVALAAAQL
jgi:ATP-dependent RNA helicase SUPV3L1/SUV3